MGEIFSFEELLPKGTRGKIYRAGYSHISRNIGKPSKRVFVILRDILEGTDLKELVKGKRLWSVEAVGFFKSLGMKIGSAETRILGSFKDYSGEARVRYLKELEKIGVSESGYDSALSFIKSGGHSLHIMKEYFLFYSRMCDSLKDVALLIEELDK